MQSVLLELIVGFVSGGGEQRRPTAQHTSTVITRTPHTHLCPQAAAQSLRSFEFARLSGRPRSIKAILEYVLLQGSSFSRTNAVRPCNAVAAHATPRSLLTDVDHQPSCASVAQVFLYDHATTRWTVNISKMAARMAERRHRKGALRAHDVNRIW